MKYISKLAAALATAVTLGATGVQAQDAAQVPADGQITTVATDQVDECTDVASKGDLMACLGAFENEVLAPVAAHQGVISKITGKTAKTGTSLSCQAVALFEKSVSQELTNLTTDVSSMASVEQLSKVRALFSATAGCLDTLGSLAEADMGATDTMTSINAVDTMRAAAQKARAMAQSLNAAP